MESFKDHSHLSIHCNHFLLDVPFELRSIVKAIKYRECLFRSKNFDQGSRCQKSAERPKKTSSNFDDTKRDRIRPKVCRKS